MVSAGAVSFRTHIRPESGIYLINIETDGPLRHYPGRDQSMLA